MSRPVTVTSPTPLRLDLGAHARGAGRDLSGVAAADGALFLAPDEGTALVRLTRTAIGWGAPVEVPLADAVALPGDPDEEVDAEGLDVVDGCLWVVGSHSAKRNRVTKATPAADVARRLATVSAERSRRLLARLPLTSDEGGPRPVPGAGARLPSGKRGLKGALADDEHLAPFLGIPGKDNGFDVEGLVLTRDGTVVLGLRGPVLRGWALLLALEIEVGGPELGLRRVRTCFVDLDGLGVRDLARDGEDLLVLAGPTMALDGHARILRLPGAAAGALPPAVPRDAMTLVHELPVGAGVDKPEGLAVLPEGLLVLHDSPDPSRVEGTVLRADLY